jgi:hypothetical protein
MKKRKIVEIYVKDDGENTNLEFVKKEKSEIADTVVQLILEKIYEISTDDDKLEIQFE